MLFETYKDSIRSNIKSWLQESWTTGEAPVEDINETYLDNVAKYLYANEYELGFIKGLDITLYDYERLRPTDADIRNMETIKTEQKDR